MNTKIKLLSVGLVALSGLFLGANFVSAQSTIVANCTSATVTATITDTSGVTTSAWFEWGTDFNTVDSGAGNRMPSQAFNSPQDFSQVIYGLTPNTTYYSRAMVSNIYGTAQGETRSFATPPCATSNTQTANVPALTTNSASSVSTNSAVLNGYVTPNGSNTSAWFEWGVTPSFGNTTPSASYGTGATSFNNSLYNLNPNTTYYYRAVAQNSYGTVYGSAISFTTSGQTYTQTYTQPSVSTNSASSVSTNSAVLNGYVTPNGTNTSAWFEWGTNYSFSNSTAYNNYGTGATSFNNSLYNLNPNTTYYYRAAAQSSYGTVYGSTVSFTTSGQTYNNDNYNYSYSQPYVSTNSASSITQNAATLNGYVTSSGSNTSAWFEWGTNSYFGNATSHMSYGTGATSFNNSLYNLNSNTTYYYRAVAQNSYGTVYGSAISFTTSGQTYYNYNTNTNVGSAPTVNTLLATELTGTTAKLNGLVFASNNQTSNAWYEWGTTSSLGNKTQVINVGALSAVKHSDFITGLVQGQIYYYRLAAQNAYGTSYGGVNSFVSTATAYSVTPTTKTVATLKPTTTVVSRGSVAQSIVTLAIDGGVEMIGGGEKRTYHVTWKNTSAQSLKNVVLRVSFPQTMKVDSATKGTFSNTDNSVVIDLKTLDAKESGDTFIFATSPRTLKSGELLVITANMVYTEANGPQGDAVAYVTHTGQATQSVLGASIFNAGDFVPTTLLGWISLMILTLSFVLLGNHLYGRFVVPKH